MSRGLIKLNGIEFGKELKKYEPTLVFLQKFYLQR